MNSIEAYNEFLKLRKNGDYDPVYQKINFAIGSDEITELENLGFSFKITSKDSKSIYISEFDFEYYENENDFLSKELEGQRGKDILIYNCNGDSYLYIRNQTYIDGCKDLNNFYFTNNFTYNTFRKYLKSLTQDSLSSSGLIDYYSGGVFVILSFNDQFKLIIDNTPLYKNKISSDVSENFLIFKKIIEENNKDYIPFLRRQLIDYLKYTDQNLRLSVFLNDLNIIKKNTDFTYDIYLYDMSIDKLEEQFQTYHKNKYSVLNELLNKAGSYIFSIPITTIGITYALNNVEDKWLLFWMGFFLICLLFFMPFVLTYYKKELDEIELNTKDDFELLYKKDFYKKNEEWKAKLISLENGIKDKSKSIKKVIAFLFSINQIINMALAVIIFIKLKILLGISITGLLGILVYSVIHFYRKIYK